MNSKISFYSIKDTEDKIKTNRFRKDKQSFFDDFEVAHALFRKCDRGSDESIMQVKIEAKPFLKEWWSGVKMRGKCWITWRYRLFQVFNWKRVNCTINNNLLQAQH